MKSHVISRGSWRADDLQTSCVPVFFVSVDRGEPPHVHVRRDNMVAKFWLEPLALERAGGFSRVELNAIATIVEEASGTIREELV